MPRGSGFVGSLKSLFHDWRNGVQRMQEPSGAGIPRPSLSIEPVDTTLALAPVVDDNASQVHTGALLPTNGGKPLCSPTAVPRPLHRKLFSRSFLRPKSPLSVSEVDIHHRKSDDFGGPDQRSRAALQDSSERAGQADALRRQAKTSRLIMATGRTGTVVLASTSTAPCTQYDSSRRCMSLDIPAMPLTSPSPVETSLKPRPLMHMSQMLCSAEMGAHLASPDLHSTILLCSSDSPAFEPPPLPPTPPTPPPAEPEPGSTTLLALCPAVPPSMRRRHWCVEDYLVTRKLCKGATSSVYKATCRHSGLTVALKVYFLSKVPTNVIHMVVREIKIHVELVHKHVVMLYGAFQDQKRLVLVQEYASRGDLYGIYRSLNRRMSEAQLTHLVLGPFLEALTYLHARGVCHRDVKPENILFTHDMRLLVADFGVSIDLNQERAVTRAGTLEYMAPEVERCPLKMLPEENKENVNLAYTTAVDIWATGVLAYELLVGFAPFVADRPPAVHATGAASYLDASGNVWKWIPGSKTLSFPSSTSSAARDFITMSLAERPEERPTALQLSRHPWLAGAVQQVPS